MRDNDTPIKWAEGSGEGGVCHALHQQGQHHSDEVEGQCPHPVAGNVGEQGSGRP